MSAEDLNKVILNMFDEDQIEKSQAHQKSLSKEYSLKDSLDSSYYDVVESGSMLDIKGNLGFHIPDEDLSSYQASVKSYTDNIEEQLREQISAALAIHET